jgi:uncharacterized integral membrane protein
MTNYQQHDDDRSGAPTAEQLRRFGPPAVLGVLALLFVFQNTDTVSFEFLWLTFEWPLWIMLLVFAAVGAVVFWGAARRRRSRKAAR